MQCRICLEEDRPDTMIAPCHCIGTSKYIHLHCLKEHTRFYPTGMCTVCNTYMRYQPRFEQVLHWLMVICIGLLLLLSQAHLVAKAGIGVALFVLIGAFAMHNCLTHELSMFVIALCILPSVVVSQFAMLVVSVGLIGIGTLYTFAHYMPVEYTFVVAATLVIGLYMGLFVISVSSMMDTYAVFLTTLNLFFFWYGWIKIHPPLRLIAD
jgi:hypothetical protein